MVVDDSSKKIHAHGRCKNLDRKLSSNRMLMGVVGKYKMWKKEWNKIKYNG